MRPDATSGPAPRVTIGLPVYNGDQHLSEALDSLLAQTFEDFELLISDNASTDRTETICREYASRDTRIRYQRLETNGGVCRNHNRLVPLARGEYFSWAAADDQRQPDCLARCVEALDRDPGAVLAYTAVTPVSETGEVLPDLGWCRAFEEVDPVARWRGAVLGSRIYDPHYGLIRTSALRSARPLGDFADSDRALLAELALRGRFHRVSEPLFRRRVHPDRTRSRRTDAAEYRAWFTPGRHGHVPTPLLRMLGRLLRVVVTAPVSIGIRLRCLPPVIRWLLDWRRELPAELAGLVVAIGRGAARRLGLRPTAVLP